MLKIALLLFLFSSRSYSSEYILARGSALRLPASPTAVVRIGNGQVVQATALEKGFQLYGKKVGESDLTISGVAHRAHVLERPDYELYKLLTERLPSQRGLAIQVIGGQLIVAGRILLWNDWEAIANLARQTKGTFLFQSRLDQDVVPEAQRRLRQLASSNHLPLPTLQLGSQPKVSLGPENKELAPLYKELYAPYGLEIENNSAIVDVSALIRVEIYITEIKRKLFRKLGIDWPAALQAQVLPSWVAPGAASGVGIQLNALEENGEAKILASPNLLCRSGKEASFFAGGEFPIRVVNYKLQDVVWKKYGILLKIKPKADTGGRMSIALESEVSNIDAAHTVDGIPGISANRIDSHFDLVSSQTIALSGLIRHDTSSAAAGLPGLKQIPILGALFSSDEFRDEHTELVVFVTPTVTQPSGDEHVE